LPNTSAPVWSLMKTKYLLNRRARLAYGAVILSMLAVGMISNGGLTLSRDSDHCKYGDR
jgi:hypothetical protein